MKKVCHHYFFLISAHIFFSSHTLLWNKTSMTIGSLS